MDTKYIPKELHHLIYLVNEWGINDDGFRDVNIEQSSTKELIDFVGSIEEKDLIILNAYLSDEEELMKSSDEYINYTCFLMAYEYSKAVLKSRTAESPQI
jgi:hypothetical protein